ncbi:MULTISPECIES: CAP domain-containing protein [Lacticaseibacillus]|uniref:CAP domain-containing protein n=1 Tax=Lacticaseibacillus TaxID=2759736 RepID=UPI00069B679C|nr:MULTISPECIES: CAP domain-containing protein [Lacticaseibacillus]
MGKIVKQKALKRNVKATNFRRWKSGKRWLYASSLIVAFAGGTFLSQEIATNQVQADTETDVATAIKVAEQVNQTATQAANQQDPEAAANVPMNSQALDSNSGQDHQTTANVESRNPVVERQQDGSESPVAVKLASQASAPTFSPGNEEMTSERQPFGNPTFSVSDGDYSVSATTDLNSNVNIGKNSAAAISELQSVAASVANSDISVSGKPISDIGSPTNNQEEWMRHAIETTLYIDQYTTSASQSDVILGATTLAAVSSSAEAAALAALSAATPASSASQPWLTAPDLSSLVKQISDVYNLTLGDAVKWVIKNGVNGALGGLSAIVSGLKSVAGSLPVVNVILPLASGAIKAAQDAVTVANSLGIDPTGLVSGALNLGINAIGKAIQGVVSPVLKSIPLVGQNLVASINPLLDTATNIGPASIVKAVAGVVGLSGVLTGVSNITATVAPTIINTLQGILNISVSVVNGIASFAGSGVNLFKDVLSGIMAPIQWVINKVKTTIQGLFPNSKNASTGTNPGNNTPPSSDTTPDKDTNSGADPVNSSAAAKTPLLTLLDVTLPLNANWDPAKMALATDSSGKAVTGSQISLSGTVDVTTPGVYFVKFGFTDSNGTVLTKYGKVTVGMNASSSSSSDSATLASITNAIQALPHTDSNLASRFTSTTNYPSKEAVYLAANPDFKPDAKEIAAEFLQYVNQLRTLNGQKPLTYSASEEAFATKRVQEIMTNFSHDGSHGSTEDIGASKGIIEDMRSNQEIAYYLVMDWYDESDNPEPIGDGHYGHRANLLYGGPTMGLAFTQSPSEKNQYSYYYAFEAPTYSDKSLYDKALAMANAKTNPQTVPLPDTTFVYVDSPKFASLQAQLKQLQTEQKAVTPNPAPAIKTVAIA